MEDRMKLLSKKIICALGLVFWIGGVSVAVAQPDPKLKNDPKIEKQLKDKPAKNADKDLKKAEKAADKDLKKAEKAAEKDLKKAEKAADKDLKKANAEVAKANAEAAKANAEAAKANAEAAKANAEAVKAAAKAEQAANKAMKKVENKEAPKDPKLGAPVKAPAPPKADPNAPKANDKPNPEPPQAKNPAPKIAKPRIKKELTEEQKLCKIDRIACRQDCKAAQKECGNSKACSKAHDECKDNCDKSFKCH